MAGDQEQRRQGSEAGEVLADGICTATIYLVQLIPAWSSGATKRVTRAPKLMFVDSGLASYLQAPRTSEQSGGLMENFVMGELARQLTWSETAAALYHYHDRDGHEVDAILENNGGRVVGIEVKSAQSVRSEDLLGLRYLKQQLGSRMHAGYVLYCGADSLSFGDGLGVGARVAHVPDGGTVTFQATGPGGRNIRLHGGSGRHGHLFVPPAFRCRQDDL